MIYSEHGSPYKHLSCHAQTERCHDVWKVIECVSHGSYPNSGNAAFTDNICVMLVCENWHQFVPPVQDSTKCHMVPAEEDFTKCHVDSSEQDSNKCYRNVYHLLLSCAGGTRRRKDELSV